MDSKDIEKCSSDKTFNRSRCCFNWYSTVQIFLLDFMTQCYERELKNNDGYELLPNSINFLSCENQYKLQMNSRNKNYLHMIQKIRECRLCKSIKSIKELDGTPLKVYVIYMIA